MNKLLSKHNSVRLTFGALEMMTALVEAVVYIDR